MPKKYKKPRLTDRDIEMITWIAEQNVVRFDTLHKVMAMRYRAIHKSLLYSLCDKWNRMGYVKKQKFLGDSPTILWATTKALKLAGFHVKPNERASSPSFSNLLHDCAVSVVRLEYESRGASWICERKLRDLMPGSHLPDGLAIYDSARILVEIDRTKKSQARLEMIMSTNARTPDITCVDYWAPEALVPFIASQIEKLDSSIRSRVRVFQLPAGVNL